MTARVWRLRLTGAVVLLAVACGVLVAIPAFGGPRPGQVDLVQVVGATRTSLTLDWQAPAGATGYQVELATNKNMTDRRRVASPHRSTVKLTGLKAGRVYCFQVRAMKGRIAGRRSARTCKPTIVDQGSARGSAVRLLTYNVCVKPCGRWGTRRGPALDLIRSTNPDVISLQEAPRNTGIQRRLGRDYQLAHQKGGKVLLFRKHRFKPKRAGHVDLGRNPAGSRHFWAVWADLADRDNGGERAIFTSVHLASGPDNRQADRLRGTNTRRLIDGVRSVNRKRVPVVYAGDFNWHRKRRFDAPAKVLHDAGYWDAYDLAESLVRPNFNSANQMKLKPVIGNLFGDHVDHFWVNPRRSQVLTWRNAARVVDGRYDHPLPSNHNPIFARVVLN